MTSLRKLAGAAALAALLLPAMAVSHSAWAAKAAIYTKFFSNVAAGGYDVTTYFPAPLSDADAEITPLKGSKEFKTEYQDAEWHFASQENLDKFVADPQRYAPQYGGYCAWAVAQGKTASGDPLLWTVHNGKLYLNYNEEINDKWRADMDNFIVAGDQNWPAVLN